jgi:ribosomal protein S18 acetylase RimI-like enzyme
MSYYDYLEARRRLQSTKTVEEQAPGALMSSLANFGASSNMALANLATSIKAQAQANQTGIDNTVSPVSMALNPHAVSSFVVNQFNQTEAGKLVNKKIEQGATAVEGTLKKASENLSDKVNKKYTLEDENGETDYSKLLNPKVLLNVVSGGLGSMAPAFATTAITKSPTAGMAMMGLQGKGNAYDDYINSIAERKGIKPEEVSGKDIKDANQFSTYYGIISGALEKFGILGSLDKIGKKMAMEGIKKYLIQVPLETLKVATQEGSTEGLQQFTQNTIAKYSGIDPGRDLMDGVVESAVVGAVTGAPFGAAVGMKTKRKEKAKEMLSETLKSDPTVEKTVNTFVDKPLQQQDIAELSSEQRTLTAVALKSLNEVTPSPTIEANISALEQSGVTLPKLPFEVETKTSEDLLKEAEKRPLTLEDISQLDEKDVVNLSIGLQSSEQTPNVAQSLKALEKTGIELPSVKEEKPVETKVAEESVVEPKVEPTTTPTAPTSPVAKSKAGGEMKTPNEKISFNIAKKMEGKSDDVVISEYKKDIKNYRETGIGFEGNKQPLNASLLRLEEFSDLPAVKKEVTKATETAIQKGEIEINGDGSITVYRVGGVPNDRRLASVTYSKDYAQEFSKGEKSIEEFKIKKEDVRAFIGKDESELLVKSDSLKKRSPKEDALITEARKYGTEEEFLNENIKTPDNIKIHKTEYTNINNGQYDGYIPAYDNTGKKVGFIDFSDFENEVQIRMVNVDKKYRGKGIAKALIAKLQQEFPESKLKWTFETKDGEALRNSYEKTKSQLSAIYKQANEVPKKEPIKETPKTEPKKETSKTQEITPKAKKSAPKTSKGKKTKKSPTMKKTSQESVENFLKDEEIQDIFIEMEKEINPYIRGALTFEVFKKIISKVDPELSLLGEFSSKQMLIRLSRSQTREEFIANLKHEIRHYAFLMMPEAQKNEIISWYKNLSENQKIEIYGNKDTYEGYKNEYSKHPKYFDMLMADETANWSMDKLGKKDKEFGGIVGKYKQFIEYISSIFSRIFDRYGSTARIKSMYESAFKQSGGSHFYISKKEMEKFKRLGAKPGMLRISNKTYDVDSAKEISMRKMQKKTTTQKVMTEKGNLNTEMLFRESYKKATGTEAPEYLVQIFRKSDKKLVVKWGNITYQAGKEVERSLNDTKKEFSQSAEEYVNRFVRKEKRGDFIRQIMAVKNTKELDNLMEKVQKFIVKDSLGVKMTEAKKLEEANKVKERFKALNAKFRERNLEARRKNLANIKAIRAEFKATTKGIKDKQALASKYVKESLPLSVRGRFVDRVKNARTEKSLTKLMKAVDERRNFYELQQLKKSMARIITQMGALPIDNQKAIVAIIENIGMTFPKKIRKKLNIPYKLDENVKSILRELGIEEGKHFELESTSFLMKVHSKLVELQMGGREEIKLGKEMKEQEKERKVTEIVADAYNLDKFDSQDKSDEKHRLIDELKSIDKEKLKSIPKKLQNQFIQTQLILIGTDRATNAMSKGKQYEGAVTKNIVNPVEDAHNVYSSRDSVNKASWNEFQEKVLGFDTGIGIIKSDLPMGEKLKAFYEMQYKQTKKLEKMGKRVFIAMAREMDGGREAMNTDKLNPMTDKEIDGVVLDEKEQKLALYLRKYFDATYPRVNEAYTAKNPNDEVGFIANYVPLYSTKEFTTDTDIDSIIKRIGFSSVKERVGGEHTLSYNAIADFTSYMEHAEYYINMSTPLNDALAVINDPRTKEALGENATNFLKTWHHIMVRKGGSLIPETGAVKVMYGLIKNINIMTLGFSDTTFLAQPTAMLNGAREIGAYVTSGARDIFNKDWRTFMMGVSAQMRDRNGAEIGFNDKEANTLLGKTKTAAMWHIKIADVYAAGSVWIGAYQKKMDELKLPVDFDNVNVEARRYADRVVRLTQASASYKDAPQILYGKNKAAAKPFFMFQSFVLSAYGQMTTDVKNDIDAGHKSLAAIKLATAMGAVIVGNATPLLWRTAILGATASGLASYDEENMAKVFALESFIRSIPFVGNAYGAYKYQTSGIPPLDALLRLSKQIKGTFNSVQDETKTRNAIKAIATLVGITMGLPTNVPTKYLLHFTGLEK